MQTKKMPAPSLGVNCQGASFDFSEELAAPQTAYRTHHIPSHILRSGVLFDFSFFTA